MRLTDPDGRQSSDELHGVGTSHHTPEQAAAARAASDAAASKPTSTSPGDAKKLNDDTRSPESSVFGDKPKEKPDKPNLWIASVYQGIGAADHPGSIEVEANVGGALTKTTGLGKPPGTGGGLNTASFAIRKFGETSSELTTVDVGVVGSGSYLTSGGIGAERFPNAAALAGTLHLALKWPNDWGGGAYVSGGGAWARDPSGSNKWLGATGGGTATLAVGHEPDDGLNYGLNASGSYLSQGQLTQGPTLTNLTSGSLVATILNQHIY